ncbi:NAD(P)-dependent oxidoreductase [Streptomyces chartreusis]|uniref:NAD(P)-dependent oxidoreductase n=1 Tax=Streptomyces chartreusis TaxID=1969 RepID=A0A7H8T1E5_STRCX|nr:NAD(P)-dependent oxidoreductase [Streptomyces chartreusis]QKZ17316.1 NAD(P)-dependent oxidoreductase [Streptomyces chartreusis]
MSPSGPFVTFIGVGAIGLPMATRLMSAGLPTTGVDPSPAAAERGASVGVSVVANLTQAPYADVVVVMVATPEQLGSLVTDALASTGVSGQRWIIMSTVGPEAVRTEGERLRAAHASVVDVPVTGGVARARTGELTLFASGSEADVNAVRSVLNPLGQVRHVGEQLGDGQSVKVVNQHLCAVHIVAAAEALALAQRLGLDPAIVLPLVESGSAGSWMLSDRGPRMLQNTEVEVTSTIGIFVKDSGLVADAARGAGADTALLDLARERYLAAASAGLIDRDDSRVIDTYHPDSSNQEE